MADKLTTCKACGNEVAKGAKSCPNCGKDQRSFFARHKIISGILALVVFVTVVGALGGGENGDNIEPSSQPAAADTQETQQAEQQVEPPAEPLVLTVDELVDALEDNALKASNTYKGQYVEVTGRLSNIDSSGNYFSLDPLNDKFSFVLFQCYISEEHLDTVANFTSGQEVTATGTITEVGEVLGYSFDVETIK